MSERIKTDIRMSELLHEQVNSICTTLGITRNAYYNLAIAMSLDSLPEILKKRIEKSHSFYETAVDNLFGSGKFW